MSNSCHMRGLEGGTMSGPVDLMMVEGAQRRRRGQRSLVAILLAVGVASAACGGATESSSSDTSSAAAAVESASEVGLNLIDAGDPVDGGALVAAVSAETDGWNPHRNQWANWGAFVGSSFLEPL